MQADFPTASAAVRAALDIQRSVDRYGRSNEAIAPFQIRIGIAVDEVLMEANDDSGIAVNGVAGRRRFAAPAKYLLLSWSNSSVGGE